VRTVTYQHYNDAVSGTNWDYAEWMRGGSTLAGIPGAENVMRNLMGPGSDNPDVPAEGPLGNKSGHNNYDNDKFIFDIKPGQRGYVRPREDIWINK